MLETVLSYYFIQNISKIKGAAVGSGLHISLKHEPQGDPNCPEEIPQYAPDIHSEICVSDPFQI